jgi:hypothetical protein
VIQRSLWPREHGAYAQLAVPLAAALVSRASLPGAAIAVAACLAFVANEPLLVVAGQRGARRREQDGARARRRLVTAATLAIACGTLGLVLAPAAWLAALAVAVPAAAVVALAWTRAQHSLAGELVAAVALTGAAAPVAVAGGASLAAAFATWAAWTIGFGCSVIAVHRVLARHRREPRVLDRMVAVALAGVAVIAALVAVAAVPLCAIATVLVLRPPPATRLRAIGVALVIASLASGVLACMPH